MSGCYPGYFYYGDSCYKDNCLHPNEDGHRTLNLLPKKTAMSEMQFWQEIIKILDRKHGDDSLWLMNGSSGYEAALNTLSADLIRLANLEDLYRADQ